jgi:hypothetical protein
VGEVLLNLLQPLQEHRYTAMDLLNALATSFEPHAAGSASSGPAASTEEVPPPLIAPLEGDPPARPGNIDASGGNACDDASDEFSDDSSCSDDESEEGAVSPSLKMEIAYRVEQLRSSDAALQASAAEILVELVNDENTRDVLCKAGDSALWLQLLAAGTEAVCVIAARAVRCLTVFWTDRAALGQAGAVALLTNVISRYASLRAQEAALIALHNLVLEAENSPLFAAGGTTTLLVRLLTEGAPKVKEEAAYVMHRLSYHENIRSAIVLAGAIPALVRLLREGTESTTIQTARALTFLAGVSEFRGTIVAAGAVPALLYVLEDCSEKTKASVGVVLFQLSKDADCVRLMLSDGALPVLERSMMERPSSSHAGPAAMLAIVLLRLRGVVADCEPLTSVDTVDVLAKLLHHGCQIEKEAGAIALWDLISASFLRTIIDAAATISPHHAPPLRNIVGAAGIIPHLVHWLRDGTDRMKALAAGLLRELCEEEDIVPITVAEEVVPLLVKILRDEVTVAEVSAVRTLEVLAYDCRKAVISAGATPLLVRALREGSKGATEAAVDALVGLAVEVEGVKATVAAGATELLLNIMREGTLDAKWGAVKVVRNLARAGDAEVDAVLVGAGAVPLLLHSLYHNAFSLTGNRALLVSTMYYLSENEDYSRMISRHGAVPLLVRLLRKYSLGTMYTYSTVDNLLRLFGLLLGNLAVDADTSNTIAAAGTIKPLVRLLRKGMHGARLGAVTALCNLAEVGHCGESMISANAIPVLVRLLRDGNTDELKGLVAQTLSNLADDADNCEAISRAGAAPLLVQWLSSNASSEDAWAAARTLWSLADEPKGCEAVAAAGAIPVLVQLVDVGDECTQELAAGALAILSRVPSNRNEIAKVGGVAPVVRLLEDGAVDAQLQAAIALCNLAEEQDCGGSIVSAGAIPVLVQLLCNVSMAKLKRLVVTTLSNLSDDADNCEAILCSGAAPLLVQWLSINASSEDAWAGARTLWSLADEPKGCEAIVAAGAIPVLVRLVDVGDECAQQEAADTLARLSRLPRNNSEIARAGAILPLVRLLKGSSVLAKVRAAAVLRTLAINAECRNNIVTAGAIPLLVQLLSADEDDAPMTAKVALMYLVHNNLEGVAALRAERGTFRRLQSHTSENTRNVATQILSASFLW